MLSKKVILFYKLLLLSFFYRVKKKSIFDIGLIGHHEDCLLFNLDQFLYLMFRLIHFFFNLVKKKGGLFLKIHEIFLEKSVNFKRNFKKSI